MYAEKSRSLAMAATASEVSLNDWDIVNAGTFAAVNSGIILQRSTPAKFALANPPMGTAQLSGDWNIWRLVPGGGGKTVTMEMPIKSGTASVMAMPLKYAKLELKSGTAGLSPDGLTLAQPAGSTAAIAAFSTVGAGSGKFYFEIALTGVGGGGPGNPKHRAIVGLVTDTNFNTLWYQKPASFVFRSDGYLGTGQTAVPFSAPAGDTDWDSLNDRIGVAVDLDNGKIWFRSRGGAWLGAGSDPSTGAVPAFQGLDLSKTYYIAVAVESGATATINLDGKGWNYAGVPMGFTPGLIDRAASSTVTNLAGATVSASISFKQVATPTTATKLMAEDVGTVSTPAVSVASVTLMDGSAASNPVVQAFNQALNAQIGAFTNIFHIIDESAQVQKTMQWMTPVLSDYAVADLTDASGAVTGSVLAILNKTEANTSTKPLTAQVDPNIIANLPTGANAVVAISAERLTQKILLPGAMAIAGAKEDDFEITDLNRKVKNKKALKFGDIKLNTDANSPDLTVNPDIPVGGMTLSIEGRTILIQYRGLSFPYDNVALDKQETVTFGFDQRLYLKNETRTDGHHILFPTLDDPKNPKGKGASGMQNFTISMNLTPGQVAEDKENGTNTTAIIIGCVIGGVLLLVGAGALARWACAGAAEAAAADGAGAAAAAGGGAADAAMPASIYDIVPNAAQMQQFAAENIYEAVDSPFNAFVLTDGRRIMASKPTTPMPAGAMPFKARWAVGFAHLNTMASVESSSDLGMTKAQIKQFSQGNFDVAGIEATVEKFVENALKPFDWPQTVGWDFVDAELNGSLLIYGTITSK